MLLTCVLIVPLVQVSDQVWTTVGRSRQVRQECRGAPGRL